MKLSTKVQNLAPSVTLQAAGKSKGIKSTRSRCSKLNGGQPDFVTPKNIEEAAIAAIQSGEASFYTQSAGIPELRQAIVTYMKENYGLDYSTNQTIVLMVQSLHYICFFPNDFG